MDWGWIGMVSLFRHTKVTLTVLTDEYIDFRDNYGNAYFAFICKKDLGEKDYEIYMRRFRNAMIEDRKVNLVLERKAGPYNKKQLMDYVIMAEFH